MKIVLLGPPGAGKGTQAQLISEHNNIPLISTGNILREAVRKETELGSIAKKIMQKGDLIPDDIIIKVIQERISNDDCKNGYILDGFPRTIPQADALKKENIHIDFIIEIFVSASEILERLSGRRVHPASGRTYHILYSPPKKLNYDDITGEPLMQRPDDMKKTILERIKVYNEKTAPLVAYYQKLENDICNNKKIKYVRIDGSGSVEDVSEKIKNLLKR